MSGGGEEPGLGEGLYSEVQCIMGNGHMGTPLWTEWWTDTYENITLLQVRWWVVIICYMLHKSETSMEKQQVK